MGLLVSCCCGSEDDESGEYGERRRLISECNSHTQIPAGLLDDHQHPNNLATSLPRINDENSKLGQILEDFTQEIIDISVVDDGGDTLLQTEINEKMAFYTGKLEEAGARIVRSTVPGPRRERGEVSDWERNLIARVAAQVESAVRGVRVEQSEEVRDLVVGLGENTSE